MKSYDFEGYTTKDGDVICTDCTGQLHPRQEEELGYHPIFADSEWDYYPTCGICGAQLDYVSLTSVGRQQELIGEQS